MDKQTGLVGGQKAVARYVAVEKTGASGAIYTCPMHPEIRQSQPGNCPICGMTLELVMPKVMGKAFGLRRQGCSRRNRAGLTLEI